MKDDEAQHLRDETIPLGWRARISTETCADCGATSGNLCRVAYGKGPAGALPDHILDWAHTQRMEKEKPPNQLKAGG